MSQEWVAILALVALFVVGTVLPINMGALGFVAAWLVGMWALGMDEKEIIAGMSGDLILTLVGVTYLFAIAKNNGTVDLIVRGAVRLVGGRVALIPWVMFFVTALLTAIGAASPAACAIIGPIALGFAGRHHISPLLMGMFVVHGAQAGGFSPISIYGTITNSVMEDNDLPVSEVGLFMASLLVNLAIAVVLFVALGGRSLMSRRIEPLMPEDEPREDAAATAGPPGTSPSIVHSGGSHRTQSGGSTSPVAGSTAPAGTAVAGTGTETAVQTSTHGSTSKVTPAQVITLVAFALVALIALIFDRNIGFAAITAAVILTGLFPKEQKGAVSQIAWATVLLVAGVSCFAAILEAAGAPEYVGGWAAGLGVAAVGALVLCYVGGVVSAFASSTALLPIIIPIAVPLINSGGISAVALVAALAVSSTIVDVSPFSTNGALMVANRPDSIGEETFYKQILSYSMLVVLVGPLLVWAVIVLPSGL
jgi:Na+/H+ antiporter NhaD/arsenite permease-like protein